MFEDGRAFPAHATACLFALAFCLAIAAAADEVETFEMDLMLPITYLEPDGETLHGLIEAGARHGMVIGGLRDVIRGGEAGGARRVGKAELASIDDSVSVVTLFAEEGDTIRLGDAVEIRLELPRPERDYLTWRLARKAIVFYDMDYVRLTDYHDVLDHDGEDPDAPFLDAAAFKVRDLVPYLSIEEYPNIFVTLEEGRYAGKTTQQVMTEATPEDIRTFLHYVVSYPTWYTAQEQYIEQRFADWVVAKAPPSSLELLDATLGLAREDALAYLSDRRDFALELMIADEWYTDALRYQAEGREIEREAVIGAMGVLSEAIDIPRFWDLYWSVKANLHQDRQEWDEAARCWREAIAAAEPRSLSRAVSHNNLGNVLQNPGRYEEALDSYQTALDYYGVLPDTLSEPEAAEPWRGAGQCLTALGRVDESAAALKAAAELFARRGGLIDVQRRCGTLSELGDVYESVGRYREAIDAWTLELYAAEELDWPGTVATAHDDMSDGFWNLGELQRAVDERLESVRIYTEQGNERDLAIANTNLGSIYWQLGDAARARERYQAALSVHEAREEWWDVADVLQRMGTGERQKGNHAQARELLDSSLEIFRRDGWTSDAAAVELELAESFESNGRSAQSDSLYALALADYRGAEDTAGEAKLLEWWGYSLIGRKETDAAREKLDLALALSEDGGDLFRQANIWRVLSNLYSGLDGDHEAGIAAAERSLGIARGMPSKSLEAQALSQLANCLFNTGRIDDAFARMSLARDIFRETGNQAGIAESQNTLGRLHAARGEYPAAVAAFETAMDVARAADLKESEANILSAMAWQAHLYGEDEIAFQTCQQAYGIYKELDNDWAMADLNNTLGASRAGLGLFDDSLAFYRLSLEIREAWGDPYGMAAAHNNMGDVYRQLGDCTTAVEHFRAALEIGERIGYVDVLTITAGNLARCYHELGRTDEALDLIDRGLELARAVDVPPRIIDMHIFRADLLFELDELDAAAAAIREGLTVAAPMGTTVSTMTMGAKLGAVDWKRGRHAEAETRLREVIPEMREMRNPVLLWEPLFYLGRVQRDRGEAAASVDAFREAIDALEQVRQGLEDEEMASGFQEKHGDVYRELVDVLMGLDREEEAWKILGLMKSSEAREMGAGAPRLNDDEQALVNEAEDMRSHEASLVRLLREELARPVERQRPELVTTWQAEIDSLKLQFQDFTRSLRDNHAQAYERLEVEPVTFNQLRRGLLETEAFVEPVVLPDRIVVFVVRGGDEPLVYREIPVSETRVDKLIRDMRAGLEQPDDDWETARTARLAGRPAPEQKVDPSVPARELQALLIDPLAGDLVGVETLIVSPSGRLRYIPFGALYDGERYLLERYRISVLTQAGTLTSRRPITADASLLAFGNPDSSLSGAAAEVNELEEIWSPALVTAVYGENATKARLRSEAGTHDILHLATHGVLLNDRPEASYLVLAGGDESDNLTFRDIVLLDLYDVDLTVLSACETAVGDHGEGKEIAGLAYNFEQTGAAAVIASLWMVNDASTSELMTNLYRNLRAGDATKVEALRQAQLALRHSEDYAHPYYWAPFILIGNWR